MKRHYYTFIFLLFPSERRGRKVWQTPNKTTIFNPRYVHLEIFLAYDTPPPLFFSQVNMDRTMINRQRRQAKISTPIGLTDKIKATQPDVTAGLIPQNLQREVQVNLTSLDGYHKSGEWTKLCVRRSARFCSQNGWGACIGLLTSQLQSRHWGGRTVRFLWLTLKVVMQNDRDFLDIILLDTNLGMKRSVTSNWVIGSATWKAR